MKRTILTLLRNVLRISGNHLLDRADATVRKQIDQYEKAHLQLSTEIFERADHTDELREQIAQNIQANNAAATKQTRINKTLDNLYALLG